MPLHIRILIALVLGAAIGLAINPGEVEINARITVVVEGAETEDSEPAAGSPLRVVESDANGRILLREVFADESALARSYPGLVRGNLAGLLVTDTKAHIVQNEHGTTIRYSRSHDGDPAISTIKLSTESSPDAADPEKYWIEFNDQHGGGFARGTAMWAKRIGDLFLRLLKMITIPLIVTSLVTGVAGLGGSGGFGRMFGRTLLYYVGTSLLAITTGILMVNLIEPGIGAILPGGGQPMTSSDQPLSGVFLGLVNRMIPTNPIESLAAGEFLSVITFSILFGIFIIRVGGTTAETLRTFFRASFEVMMRMTMAVIALAPIGVFAFMLYATSTQGLDIFLTLGWYMLTVFLALLVHACVVLPLIVAFIARRSPAQFAREMSPALMTAFSTASSNATLPLTITSVEQRAGVSNRVSSFVLPLGATINMDGTALYEAVAVLFIAQATPGFDMTIGSQIIVAITALLASVGAAGIPHAGLVMMAIVLQAVGLPLEAQGVIIAVDRVLDMCRTSVNVWSDSCGCAVLNRFEQDLAGSAP